MNFKRSIKIRILHIEKYSTENDKKKKVAWFNLYFDFWKKSSCKNDNELIKHFYVFQDTCLMCECLFLAMLYEQVDT